METIGLVLGLVKVALEVFKDERRGRFLNQLSKIEKGWNDEMDLPESDRSDLELDRLLRESKKLASRIIEQHSKK